MLWDVHMHTNFSGDSAATPESMIQGAKEKGLSGMCFTDHFDLDYIGVPEGYFVADLERYVPKCYQLIEENRRLMREADHFTICAGIELGIQAHLVDELNKVMSKYQFDFVIASSHMGHKCGFSEEEFFEGKTEDEAYAECFNCMLEHIQAFDNFDVYGHLDYVVRYGPNQNRYYSYEKFKEQIDEILKLLIAKGKGIEINTSGLRKGLGQPHPTQDILKRYRELGGEIITMGSDAHAPEQIAYGFDKVPEMLKEAGFRYFTVFKERKPEFLRIS